MITALVIGFGPFPGAPQNPSAELVRRLAKQRLPSLAGTRVIAHVLPTSYAAVNEELPALLRRHDPDAVLFFGLASRTPYLRIEQRAVNKATGFYADASRTKYATRALTPGLPAELRVRADARRLHFAARATRIDARLSRDAGRYICNAAFYRTLHMSDENDRPWVVAFVHIPRPRRRGRLDGKRGRTRPSVEALMRAGGAVLAALVAEARRS
ncbi:MAG TPA: pyroglutamyl-peptidase I [Xanthobacteraceae bacterium]|nr:pyroglutamyl-peptidase I [Xanthobacteraceae bacterium]